MYLSNLKLWNFRKFGSDNDPLVLDKSDLDLNFNVGLNVLIGENDSGKTAIVDAVKIVLKTHSYEWIKVNSDDFYEGSNRLRIELRFDKLSPDEAKNFTEWLGMDGEGDDAKPFLRIIYDVSKINDKIIPSDIKAGVDDDGYPLNAEAREFLKTTYLKPLRDAKTELIPRRNSRLSQILMGHPIFEGKDDNHDLVKEFKEFNKKVKEYFKDKESEADTLKDGNKIKVALEKFLNKFFEDDQKANFSVSDLKVKNILETLKLTLDDEKLGLGSHNLLFMATELLNLERDDWCGLRLGLIEEIEAHLHPQAQLRVIEFLQDEVCKENLQLIITTHSPNLGSKVDLKNLIICHDGKAFPMGEAYTELAEPDYKFLQRFLDVTKSNIFFAKGVILVEGWAEELLLPVLADKIDLNLTDKGVSVVNIGNTAFLRYANIFKRKDEPKMDFPIAVITDIDVKPDEYNSVYNSADTEKDFTMSEIRLNKEQKYDGQKVKTFVSPKWTLEYCIALSDTLKKLFYTAVLQALKEQKVDEGIQEQRLAVYESAINNLDDHFSNWQDENIALNIYLEIIGERKILDLCTEEVSKAIIAQHFAEILKASITKEELEQDVNIRYLLDAIKYACR